MLAYVSADFRPLMRGLDDLAKRQLPFATARAVTEMAQTAAFATRRALPSIFDRPTPFTRAGIAVAPARKGNPIARVFVKDRQAEYLHLQEEGGVQRPKKKALVIPVGVPRNRYGNLQNKAFQRLKAESDTFIGTVRGVGGLWKRPERGTRRDGTYGTIGSISGELGFNTGLQLLIRFTPQAAHTARFQFKGRAIKVAQATMGPAFRQQLAKAIATARR